MIMPNSFKLILVSSLVAAWTLSGARAVSEEAGGTDTGSEAEAGASEAAEAFRKGIGLFNAENHAEAVKAFRHAYALKPSWKLMYNIGQCEAALTRYGLAIEAFEAYLGRGGDGVSVERRDEVLAELDRMRKMVGGIKVTGPDGVEIFVDGVSRAVTPCNAAILVTAGVAHTISFRKPGSEPVTMQETISGGQTMTLNIPADPETAPPAAETVPESGTPPPAEVAPVPPAQDSAAATPKPVAAREKKGLSPALFWAGTGTFVAFGGAALGLALTVESRWKASEQQIDDNPWTHDARNLDDIRMMQIATYAGLGLSAAGLIMMVVAIPLTDWRGGESADGAAALTIRPWRATHSGGLVLEGRF